jgi:hypothetical protein
MSKLLGSAKSIIHNKYVLYFVFFISLLNLLFSATKGDYFFCSLFILIGFVSAFFNKNMTVILVCTVAISNIVRVLIRGGGQFEGMTTETDLTNAEVSNSLKDEPAVASKESAVAPNLKVKDLSIESDSAAPPKTAAASKTTVANSDDKKKLVTTLKNEAQDLLEVQQKIIQGFSQIEPNMARAESLIKKIEDTSKQIQAFQGMSA